MLKIFGEGIPGAITFILFIVFVFFILREFFTWYWKINKITKLLEKIEENTSKNKNLAPTNTNEEKGI